MEFIFQLSSISFGKRSIRTKTDDQLLERFQIQLLKLKL